jgi:hypothetical protein
LFIPQGIYEHEKSQWDDIDREKHLVHQGHLTILPEKLSSGKAGRYSEENY